MEQSRGSSAKSSKMEQSRGSSAKSSARTAPEWGRQHEHEQQADGGATTSSGSSPTAASSTMRGWWLGWGRAVAGTAKLCLGVGLPTTHAAAPAEGGWWRACWAGRAAVVAVVALAVAEQAATSLVGPLTGQFYALLTSVNDDHHQQQQRGAGWPPLSFVGFLAHAAAVLLLVASLRALAQVQPPFLESSLVGSLLLLRIAIPSWNVGWCRRWWGTWGQHAGVR